MATYNSQKMLSQNRANTVANLPKAVPLCRVKREPIRESLQARRLTGRDDSRLRRVDRAHSLEAALVSICPCTNCRAKACRIKPNRFRHFIFFSTCKLTVTLRYNWIMPCPKASRHQTILEFCEVFRGTYPIRNSTFKSISKSGRDAARMFNTTPGIFFPLPIGIDIDRQTLQRLAYRNLFNVCRGRKICVHQRRNRITPVTYEKDALAGCRSTIITRPRLKRWQYDVTFWHKRKCSFQEVSIVVIEDAWNVLRKVKKRFCFRNEPKEMNEGNVALIFNRLLADDAEALARRTTYETVKLPRLEPKPTQKCFAAKAIVYLVGNVKAVRKINRVCLAGDWIALNRTDYIETRPRRPETKATHAREQVNDFRLATARKKFGHVSPGLVYFATGHHILSHFTRITESLGTHEYEPGRSRDRNETTHKLSLIFSSRLEPKRICRCQTL